MIPFGPWLPDQHEFQNPGALTATNVFPGIRGYRPIPQLQAFSSETATGAAIRGLASFKDTNGALRNYVGVNGGIEQTGSDGATLVGVSPPSVALLDSHQWAFITFGDNIIAAGGTANPLFIKPLSSGSATSFAPLIDSPQAKYLTVVQNFVVAANTADNVLGPFQVQWSELDPAFPDEAGSRYWYDAGSSGTAVDALVTQADSQAIADAGVITGIVGGESGVVFLERAIVRMEYVGSPLVFTFRKVETNHGCSFPGSIIALGPNRVFYLGRDGFYIFNGAQAIPIGAEKVNQFFFDDFNTGLADRMSATVDPTGTNIIWSYPSNQSPNGDPDRLIIFNHVTKSWSYCELGPHDMVGFIRTQSASVDGAEFIGNLDTDFDVSFDSPIFKGGAFLLSAAKDSKVQTFTGTPMSAVLETSEFEPSLNQRSVIHKVVPYVTAPSGLDASTITAQVFSRSRQTDAPTGKTGSPLNAANFCPVRANGRYHRVRLSIAETDWRYALGVDVESTQAGGR